MEIFPLLLSTVLLRPYVFIFLGLHLLAGGLQLGLKRITVFTLLAYLIAFTSEYSSTRNGIPYGPYIYTGETHGKELYISNVPFMDSLSYAFLAYFSYSLALLLVSPVKRNRWKAKLIDPPWHSKGALFLSAFLMTLQDVVVDPVALRGSGWFLGQIFYYPDRGTYFGVPLSNFVGWFVVGLAIIYCFQKLDRAMGWAGPCAENALLGPACYFINMSFTLFLTFYIGEYLLGLLSLAIFASIFYRTLQKVRNLNGRTHRSAPTP
ncbi:MAG: carotenoid biosynthesis protein, partial [Candidatus Brocadiales bacterium]